MPIAVKLQTCFGLPERMTLPEGIETVAQLLRHVGEEIHFTFMNPDSSDLDQDLVLSLNGKEIWFYPTVLNTPLKEGDLVEIYMLPLGGG